MSARTVSGPAAETPIRNQWWLATRFLSTLLLKHLIMATGVMVGLVVLGQVLGRWFNWSLVIDMGELRVSASGEDEAGFNSPLWLALPVAISIGAVVMVVIFAATRTRPMIQAGLTRRSISTGMLLSLIASLLYVSVLTTVVVLLVGVPTVLEFFGTWSIGSGELALGAALGVFTAMLAGLAIVTLFQRWPWWVGAGILLLLVTVVPILLSQVDSSSLAWLGLFGEVLRMILLGTGYWLMMRRLPVP